MCNSKMKLQTEARSHNQDRNLDHELETGLRNPGSGAWGRGAGSMCRAIRETEEEPFREHRGMGTYFQSEEDMFV